jgi:hypothetical protein
LFLKAKIFLLSLKRPSFHIFSEEEEEEEEEDECQRSVVLAACYRIAIG